MGYCLRTGSDVAGPKAGCAPLLKWPGGKRALLNELRQVLPGAYRRYFEPFFGGGALFFELQPQKAVLSDTNAELINCYQVVRDHPLQLIRLLKRLKNTREAYLTIRASRPRSQLGRATRFIYLTTLAFNGIYRVNLKGEFNVPYGGKSHIDVAQPERIAAVSRALQGRTLKCVDFAKALQAAGKGDLVYLDPPYTVAHENNGFLKYNATVFSWEDQTRLADTARALALRGAYVVVTNACHPSIRTLYHGLTQRVITRPSIIAASAEHRGSVNELLITNLR